MRLPFFPTATSVEFIPNNLLLAVCVSLSSPQPHLRNFLSIIYYDDVRPHSVEGDVGSAEGAFLYFLVLLLDRGACSARQ